MKPLELLPALGPGSGVRIAPGLAYPDAITKVDVSESAISHRKHRAIRRTPMCRLDDFAMRLEELGFDVRWEVTMRAPFIARARICNTRFRCEAETQELAVNALLKAMGDDSHA